MSGPIYKKSEYFTIFNYKKWILEIEKKNIKIDIEYVDIVTGEFFLSIKVANIVLRYCIMWPSMVRGRDEIRP